jgi:hypothetical protein
MLTLAGLKKKIVDKDFELTRDEALDVAIIFKSDKKACCEYDWSEGTVWISLWDVEFKIVDEVKEE